MQREEREISMGGCFLGAPYRGLGPQPRHVPQTGNRTGNLLVRRPERNPLSHTSQGLVIFFRFYLLLFIFRERGREGEREGEKHR